MCVRARAHMGVRVTSTWLKLAESQAPHPSRHQAPTPGTHPDADDIVVLHAPLAVGVHHAAPHIHLGSHLKDEAGGAGQLRQVDLRQGRLAGGVLVCEYRQVVCWRGVLAGCVCRGRGAGMWGWGKHAPGTICGRRSKARRVHAPPAGQQRRVAGGSPCLYVAKVARGAAAHLADGLGRVWVEAPLSYAQQQLKHEPPVDQAKGEKQRSGWEVPRPTNAANPTHQPGCLSNQTTIPTRKALTCAVPPYPSTLPRRRGGCPSPRAAHCGVCGGGTMAWGGTRQGKRARNAGRSNIRITACMWHDRSSQTLRPHR